MRRWLALLADDLFAGFVFLALLAAIVFFAELTSRRFQVRKAYLRKFVHVLTGTLLLLTPHFFKNWPFLFLAAVAFAVLNFCAINAQKLSSFNTSDKRSWGTVYYPVAFAVLLVFSWGRDLWILRVSLSLMVFADAAAGVAGLAWRKATPLRLPGDQKSLQGSFVMFLSSFLIVLLSSLAAGRGGNLAPGQLLSQALVVALIATSAEALSWRGSDNLSVPLLTALALLILSHESYRASFLFGSVFAGGIALFAFRANLLDLSGALASFLLGAYIFGVGGWLFALPILAFFLASSLLSKLPVGPAQQSPGRAAKGSRRDAGQVFANGAIPALAAVCSLIFPRPAAYMVYLGALAAAMADTWATEIGVRFAKRTRSIITWTPVERGLSGGVSLAGSVGAALGGATVAATGLLSAQVFEPRAVPGNLFAIIAIIGILAQFIDSLLGALVQRKNRCPVCGLETEQDLHCGATTRLVRGWKWVNNDAVNWICSGTGAFFTYFVAIYLLNYAF